jgi:6-pyruvoyl-tetrahydropterin synthase
MPPKRYVEELKAAAKEVIKQYDHTVLRQGTEGVAELTYAIGKLKEIIKRGK